MRIPATIQDAIKFCERIGIPYLWVDALCIVQDDAISKHTEISKMDQVYANAYIALIVATASSAYDGIPRVSKPSRGRVWYMSDVKESPWNTRGWTFQESFLAKRTILFGEGNCLLNCETCSWDEDYPFPMSRHFPPTSIVNGLWHFNDANLQEFAKLIRIYSKRCFSYEEDRVHAFRGVAASLEPIFGTFTFGLPQRQLDRALIWHTFDASAASMKRRVSSPEIPSWSWISWELPIGLVFGEGHQMKPWEPVEWWFHLKQDQTRGLVCWSACSKPGSATRPTVETPYLQARTESVFFQVSDDPLSQSLQNNGAWRQIVFNTLPQGLVKLDPCEDEGTRATFNFIRLTPAITLKHRWTRSGAPVRAFYRDKPSPHEALECNWWTHYKSGAYYVMAVREEIRDDISIMTRLGIGWIFRDTWERHAPKTVNIILG